MIVLSEFRKVKTGAKFVIPDREGALMVWTKINDDTAIADGYECSNAVALQGIVAVSREDLKS